MRMLRGFNFSGADQEKKWGIITVEKETGLHLSLALKSEGNVLLLDEPTNDIDVNTLRALEEGLESFAGCAVVISNHDRWFLRPHSNTHFAAYRRRWPCAFLSEGCLFSEYEGEQA
ncbi:MAG: hypothetical protein MZV49_11380 [Rhodopseudomonas palustris]|nr:hypothetical protein [Rhodopseudomonas palustris]